MAKKNLQLLSIEGDLLKLIFKNLHISHTITEYKLPLISFETKSPHYIVNLATMVMQKKN